jgi:hypothetical protein
MNPRSMAQFESGLRLIFSSLMLEGMNNKHEYMLNANP